MLLTLTNARPPATDLGFLLHKHPERHQRFTLPFGEAHVFYPVADAARCTATLALDIDPVALVRGRAGAKGEGGAVDHYVNDRPYAVSSFLSVALARVFGSALAGRCERRPELVGAILPLEARLVPLRCQGGVAIARALFEPLGYRVASKPVGEGGAYFDLTLSADTTLERLLTHLYVLIPVLDDEKHYWVAEDEIEKLLRHGEGWLSDHPARDLIARRALKHQRHLAHATLDRLRAADGLAPPAEGEALPPRRLNEERLDRVFAVLRESGAGSVLDLGCGSGKLLARLMTEPRFTRIVGLDVSARALEEAEAYLRLNELSDTQRGRLTLIQGALTYRDRRLAGFDAAALVEVIEHIDPPRLEAFVDAVFGVARPRFIVLTTPNAEYNARYPSLAPAAMRHDDHRFERTRAQFDDWATGVAERYRYTVGFEDIGERDPDLGGPTRLAVFRWR